MPARSPTSPAARALLVAALAATVLAGAATATPWRFALPDRLFPTGEAEATTPPPAPAPTGAPEAQSTPDALTVVAVVLAVAGALLILALLVLLARRVMTARAAPAEEETDDLPAGDAVAAGDAPAIPLADLQDAVQRALRHVDDAATPHDAVVAAWVALEDAAADHGTTRDPAETPTEFTGRLLAATPAPPASVAELRALYAEARFTRRPVAPAQVDRARHALHDVARSLDDAPAPTSPAAGPPPRDEDAR